MSANKQTEIQAKSLTAPRITPADVEANISSCYYFTAEDGVTGEEAAHHRPSSVYESALSQITFCILVLCNGTKIVGINYGSIDPNQHSAERGRTEARAHAIEQIWPLMGYELRTAEKIRGATAT